MRTPALALILLVSCAIQGRAEAPAARRAPGTPRTPESPYPLRLRRSYVRDDAQVLTAAATEAINRRVAGLGGNADIFIVTRLLDDMSLFEQASQQLFKEIVNEVDHYRVVVVIIAYSRDRDRGTIGTNLGHGLWHIVSKAQCEELFGREDAPLTASAIQAGVERLCGIIEQYERSQGSASSPTFTGFETLLKRAPLALLLLAGIGGFLWLLRRGATCPNCGAPLKTRVSISFASGRSGRLARKTYKCFRCGYARRQSLLPGLAAPESDRPTRPRLGALAAGEAPSEAELTGPET